MSIKGFTSSGLCLLLAGWLSFACDPFQEDVIQKENVVVVNEAATAYYILPNSSAVVDLKAIVTSSFTKIRIEVSEHPKRGVLASLDDYFLKYTPSPLFNEDFRANGMGKDQFTIAFVSNEKTLSTETITIHMMQSAGVFPCSLYAVEDAAHTAPGIPVSIKILFNDRLCGIKVDNVQAFVSLVPGHGEAVVKGGLLIYTPEPGFEGSDEIVYRISAEKNRELSGADGLLVSYGLVAINISE